MSRFQIGLGCGQTSIVLCRIFFQVLGVSQACSLFVGTEGMEEHMAISVGFKYRGSHHFQYYVEVSSARTIQEFWKAWGKVGPLHEDRYLHRPNIKGFYWEPPTGNPKNIVGI